MTNNTFFVVHNQESYEKHPNLIGFYAKTDFEGKPIKNKNNELIPDNSKVNEIQVGDKIIYYTLGNYSIKGIFSVKEKLKENDKRIAKDWSPTVQFLIEPILRPSKLIDFRNIIFSGKETLDMFSHLDNLKKQWGMAIGGKNYIRELSDHDYEIIEAHLKIPKKEEVEDIELPKFPRKHLEIQFQLVKIFKAYGYEVHVAVNDKNKIIEKGEEILESIPEFHNERTCDITSRIDCVAFNQNDVPRILAEVVDSIGTLTESMFRLNELAMIYPKSKELKFYIIGPDNFRGDFENKINSLTFSGLKRAACSFKSYVDLKDIFIESQKEKPHL